MGAVSVAIVEPSIQLLRSPQADVQHEGQLRVLWNMVQ